jgi:hypothetical protein
MRFHEQPTPQSIAHDHVAADRNSLSADHGVDRVQLLAETQVPGLFEGIEIGVDRARDRQPLSSGRRIRIAFASKWLATKAAGAAETALRRRPLPIVGSGG